VGGVGGTIQVDQGAALFAGVVGGTGISRNPAESLSYVAPLKTCSARAARNFLGPF